MTRYSRAFTIKDLAVTLTCLLVAGAAGLADGGDPRPQPGAGLREQPAAAVRGHDGLRQPVQQLPAQRPVSDVHGQRDDQRLEHRRLGPQHRLHHDAWPGHSSRRPRDTATGHFKWYGDGFDDLPDVCKCPAMSPALLDPANPEVTGLVDSRCRWRAVLYQYALSYQTSGTCRAAAR